MSTSSEDKYLPEAVPNEPLPLQSGGFFAKHWRGDYSLVRSYWVNGGLICGVGANMIVFSMVLTRLLPSFREQRALLLMVGFGEIAFHIAIQVWVLVGTWRAAGKYKGARIWPIAARVAMVLGVCLSIGRTLELIEIILALHLLPASSPAALPTAQEAIVNTILHFLLWPVF
jgi:hypothetical protein